MKWIKASDCLVSMILIYGFIPAYRSDDLEQMINWCFMVGGWQVLSMFLHAGLSWFTRPRGVRVIYHWFSFGFILTLGASSAWHLLLAPVLACFYLGLCITETLRVHRRPLAGIK